MSRPADGAAGARRALRAAMLALAAWAAVPAAAHAQEAPPDPRDLLPPAIPRGGAQQDLGLSQPAWERPESSLGPGQEVPGYRSHAYSWASTYQVRTRIGMITTLRIDPSEVITNMVLADPTAFEALQLQPNLVALRPLATGIDSNLMLGTLSGRLYSFYVRSVPPDTPRITDVIVDVVLSRPLGETPAGDAAGGPHHGAPALSVPDPAAEPGASGSPVPSGPPEGRDPRPSGPAAGRGERIFEGGRDGPGPGAGASGAAEGRESAPGPEAVLEEMARNPLRLSQDDGEWGNLERIPFDPSEIRFDVRAVASSQAAADEIAPVRAWSDCCWIYADFGHKARGMKRWPVAFAVSDRTEAPVAQRVAGKDRQILVIETLDDVVLRSGEHVVCLRRRGPAGPAMPPVAIGPEAMPATTAAAPDPEPEVKALQERVRAQLREAPPEGPSAQPGSAVLEVRGEGAQEALREALAAEGVAASSVGPLQGGDGAEARGLAFAEAVQACRRISEGGRACAVLR